MSVWAHPPSPRPISNVARASWPASAPACKRPQRLLRRGALPPVVLGLGAPFATYVGPEADAARQEARATSEAAMDRQDCRPLRVLLEVFDQHQVRAPLVPAIVKQCAAVGRNGQAYVGLHSHG